MLYHITFDVLTNLHNSLYMFIFLEPEGEEGVYGKDTNTDEEITNSYETVSLRFPEARDCLVEIEEGMFSFLATRTDSTHLYEGKKYKSGAQHNNTCIMAEFD